ncbi:N2227-like protein-domain-containing protein [Gorgonomyces haynaldii]|nr:N2227-like protein-domain-containing protein [Gorgonomyces haynaldii]
MSDLEEQKHFQSVIQAFRQYRYIQTKHLSDKLQVLKQKNHTGAQMVLKRMQQTLDGINKNAFFLQKIVQHQPFQFETPENVKISELDIDKVRSTLRQFVRDWSSDGQYERSQCYQPVLDRLQVLYPTERDQTRVLVPGAGLGRLALEIVNLGYPCQGNEFSYHMLLGSNFVLNQITQKEEYDIFPWIHTFSNLTSQSSQLKCVKIPDFVVKEPNADFSMTAGDFTEIYSMQSQENQWDVIVTCFFIDTAKDVFEYLQVMKHCLKNGGRWINLGPLLYHFEGDQSTYSIEYTLEEVKQMSASLGFDIQNESFTESTYSSSQESMMRYLYRCWTFDAVLTK